MVLVGPVLVGTVVVLGATPSSASGSLGAVAAAWASLVSDRLATRSDCTVPARSAGVSLLAELKMTLATPIRSNTSASPVRSEEHTSELQSLMRISYAVFCLKKKTTKQPSQK